MVDLVVIGSLELEMMPLFGDVYTAYCTKRVVRNKNRLDVGDGILGW